MTAQANTIERLDDLPPYKRWETEVDAALRELDKFHQRANYATRKYLDERDDQYQDARWFNIFYANTNILEAALYSEIPKAEVTRKYDDYKDQVARVASLILERALQQDLNDPNDTYDCSVKCSVQDRLVAGLGTAWLRLETDTEDISEAESRDKDPSIPSDRPPSLTQPDTLNGPNDGFTLQIADGAPGEEQGPQPPPQPLKRITEQRVAVDYVNWRDFIWSPCRTWAERRWTGRRVYMSREELIDRFGKDKGGKVQLNWSGGKHAGTDAQSFNNAEPRRNILKKAEVFEIWDRVKRKVVWFSKGLQDQLLDEKDDFLGLTGFEPCPPPLFANITNQNCTPRPDYYMIRDQYDELDLVNGRISRLVEACKVVGVYDQASKAVQGVFQGSENKMIPIENWAQFSEKGGMKGSVDWLPLDMVVATLENLYKAREAIKAQIYELTGISDIVRGNTKASETLGAQEMKAKFASIRIKTLQSEVAEFCSGILRIRAEIMVKHFTEDMLIRKSGITFTDNDELVPQAVALLKSEQGFKWRVSVDADSLSQADYASEKQERVEFLSAVTGFMQQTMPLAMQIPEIKPVVLGLLKWGIAGFKRAKDIEGMIDKQLSELEGKPPPPPKPDPKVAAVQAKIQGDQQKAHLDVQGKQQDMEFKKQEAELDRQMKELEMQFEQKKLELEERKMQMELHMKGQEMQMKQQENDMNLQATMQQNQVDMQTHQQVSQQKVQDAMIQSDLSKQKGEQDLQMSKAAGEQKLGQAKAEGKQKIVLQKSMAKANPGASRKQ